MKPAPRFCSLAAVALILILFLTNVYRARTQSITADEAFTYIVFLSGSFGKLFSYYDAAHHVLHTILCKLSISVFGLSEFTLRIPSLLAGLLYLVMVYRLSKHLLGRARLILLCVALLAMNPFVLDFLSLSRGYGLAIALFLWALYQLVQYFADYYVPGFPLSGHYLVYRAALGLALSVAANLTLLLPAAGLSIVFLAVVWIDSLRAADRSAASEFWFTVDSFIVPGIATAFIILISPVLKARPDNFYLGASSYTDAVRSLVDASLFHHPLPWEQAYHAALSGPLDWFVETLLVPAVFTATSLACLVVLYRWLRHKSFERLDNIDQFLFLAGGSMLIGLVLMVTAHHLFGVLYPFSRTGLYLIPLFLFNCFALWKRVEHWRVTAALLRFPLLSVAIVCLLQFVLQFRPGYYSQWRQDAGMKRIAGLIRERHSEEQQERVRAGVNWFLEPATNFYRLMYRLDWMDPATRDGPDGTFDYYVLLPADASLIGRRHLTVVYHDPVSGAVLAVPGGPSAASGDSARDTIPTP